MRQATHVRQGARTRWRRCSLCKRYRSVGGAYCPVCWSIVLHVPDLLCLSGRDVLDPEVVAALRRRPVGRYLLDRDGRLVRDDRGRPVYRDTGPRE